MRCVREKLSSPVDVYIYYTPPFSLKDRYYLNEVSKPYSSPNKTTLWDQQKVV